MHSVIIIIVFLLVSPGMVFAGCSGASPSWTCTPDYVAINGLINGGSPTGFQEGDTVTLSAGDATWLETLNLTKFMTLIGGSGTITGPESGFLISFVPSNPSANGVFRVSGFTASVVSFVSISSTATNDFDNIIIDNNIVTNTTYFLASSGNFFGVIYSNTMVPNSAINIFANNCDLWDTSYSYGSSKALYFEDNIITKTSTSDLFANTRGNRFVVRYNTFTRTKDAGSQTYWIDMHGNQDTTSCGVMSSEIYGNLMTVTNDNHMQIMDQRGGKSLTFYNSFVTGGTLSIKVREEYCDNLPVKDFVCSAPDGQTGHVYDSYYWRNLNTDSDDASSTLSLSGEGPWDCGDCGTYSIAENSNVWLWKTDFSDNSTRGMGCGTITNRPATCTTGVGYWATDQSCYDLTGMVGANPATPISGTLYKCTSTDTWEAYYTPYTYPHPLRGIPTASTSHASGSFNLR